MELSTAARFRLDRRDHDTFRRAQPQDEIQLLITLKDFETTDIGKDFEGIDGIDYNFLNKSQVAVIGSAQAVLQTLQLDSVKHAIIDMGKVELLERSL